MVAHRYENKRSDWSTWTGVVNDEWSWPEVRIAVIDLMLAPLDFWFSEIFGAKKANNDMPSPVAIVAYRTPTVLKQQPHVVKQQPLVVKQQPLVVKQKPKQSRQSQPRHFDNVFSITAALSRSLKHQERKDRFQPQPSLTALEASENVASDDDVWVERYYFNKENQRVSFFRSYKTGKCVLSEPPSGARSVVYRRDLEKAPPAIQRYAVEKLDRKVLADLKRQLKDGPKLRTIKSH